jgi:hypothetical protein
LILMIDLFSSVGIIRRQLASDDGACGTRGETSLARLHSVGNRFVA